MNNVAVNLVATLMQNNFSGKSFQLPNAQGLNQSNFSSILKQSQQSMNKIGQEKSQSEIHANQHKDENFGKSIDHMQDRFAKKASAPNNRAKAQRSDNSKDEINNESSKEKDTKKNVTSSTNDEKTIEQVTKDTRSEDIKQVSEKSVEDKVSSEDSSGQDEKMKEIEEQLIQDVASKLEMTPEELTDLLNQFQMNVFDLFNPAKFKEVMQAALHVSNSTDLLVSGDALEKLQNVTEVLSQSIASDPVLKSNKEAQVTTQNPVDTTTQEGEKNLLIRLLNNFQDANGSGQSSNGNSSEMSASSQLLGKAALSTGETPLNSTFEGILNQVVTQKTETIVMNGAVATIQTEVTAKDVLDQIVTGMKVQVSEGKSNIVLQLNPENLGKIALSLSHEKGVITGQFVAESEAVKKVIESNLNQLKTQLQNQGIQVNDLKIVVGDSAAFFAGEQEKGNGKESQESKRSRRISNISNISSNFADTILEEDNKVNNNFIHENSSIELHA